MQIDAFLPLYKKLNTKQKEAVDAIEGPVIVIAGPGTGKTSLLTLRIANILKETGTQPDTILALTFTESGVSAMRKKLTDIIGSKAYSVGIYTFHSFANELITRFPERFPRIISSTPLTDVDQLRIIEEIIEKTDLELLKPYGDPLYYVSKVLNEIKTLKREYISPDALKKILKKHEDDFRAQDDLYHEKGAHKGKMKGEHKKTEESIEKNKELNLLFELYEQELVLQKKYDFEDMIIEAVSALKRDSDFLLMLQESYQYILADEHQDANNSQNSLLELLSGFHDNPNLFIVGDEKQAIYRFQGASLENFFYFKRKYPEALVIQLEDNYRSHQHILDVSHGLIENNSLPEGSVRVKLLSRSGIKPLPIELFVAETESGEHSVIAEEIKKDIKSGVLPQEIAVLYRHNRDAFALAHTLKLAGIPYSIESDRNLLNDVEVSKLIFLFRAIHDLTDEVALGEALFADFFALDTLDVFKLLSSTKVSRLKLFDTLASKQFLTASGIATSDTFVTLATNLKKWAGIARNNPLLDCFDQIIKESGFMEYSLSSADALMKLEVLRSLLAEVRSLSTSKRDFMLKDFILHIDFLLSHKLSLKGSLSVGRGSVRLMTAHKSKGLEFDSVYLSGIVDHSWGSKSRRVSFRLPLPSLSLDDSSLEDERRLFYVALTRARKKLTISFHKVGTDGREVSPSQFVEELKAEYVEKSTSDEKGIVLSDTSQSVHVPPNTLKSKDFIVETFLAQGLSVTALNNFLKCPWNYFFTNLIRLPQAKSKHQLYGTAVHATLKTFFDKYREEEDMTKDDFLLLFEHNCKLQGMSPADEKESLKKGRASLSVYFDTYKGVWNRTLLTEYSIRGVSLPLAYEGKEVLLLLNGALDKIEYTSDTEVNVVDYKTGKPKSRNELEGKTKDADGNYRRQLTFYKLLLSLDAKKLMMESGELDFIEPDTSGKCRKEQFIVNDEDVTELQQTLVRVSEEILSLSFMTKGCDDVDCEYCKLSKLLK